MSRSLSCTAISLKRFVNQIFSPISSDVGNARERRKCSEIRTFLREWSKTKLIRTKIRKNFFEHQVEVARNNFCKLRGQFCFRFLKSRLQIEGGIKANYYLFQNEWTAEYVLYFLYSISEYNIFESVQEFLFYIILEKIII